MNANTFYRKKGKRICDIILTTIALIFFAPLMAIIALAIKLSAWNEPVIFKQVRVGKGGDFFALPKFRTMKNGAEVKKNSNGEVIIEPILTEKNDKRITFLGRILRKTALDELPQLFNVLRGEMSVVGPRSERPIFYPRYMDILKDRITVKPGLFCLTEVIYGTSDDNGNGNGGIDLNEEEGQRERMRLDREYIEKYSFWYDVKLTVIMIWKLLLREYYFSILLKNGNGNGNGHKNEEIKKYIWEEKGTSHISKIKKEGIPYFL
ncbi:MAG: sugar transferase [bacterium]